MRYLALAALVFAIVPAAKAGVTTAGDLQGYCKKWAVADARGAFETDNSIMPTSEELFPSGICMGFVSGWMQGVSGLQWEGKVIKFDPEVTVGQIARIFLKYMADHPEYEHKTADFGLVQGCRSAGVIHLVSPEATPSRMIQ